MKNDKIMSKNIENSKWQADRFMKEIKGVPKLEKSEEKGLSLKWTKERNGWKMSELQNRRYKEVSPEETVARLKELLSKLGIEVEEKWSKESSVGTYSLRICFKGTDMGQNGKGMTKEFAMASGYAEFFERMQNGIFRFRMEKPTKEIPFTNAPDEKHLSVEESAGIRTHNKVQNSFFENILKQNDKEKATTQEKIEYLKEVLNENATIVPKEVYNYLPYYSVKHKELQYIPDALFSYLFDTNGMCAGNSREEALIEGLSEILERYAGMQIFKKRICLPEIPMEYLKKFPKVEKMMEKLRKNDEYYFRLVDCSFGGKYPVAGLYMIERNTGKFGFKLGAHPDYGIAMERCFTEAAQGRDIYEYAETSIFDFYSGEDTTNRNLTEFIFADMGTVPYQVVGEKADYAFTEMPDVSDQDNKTILRNLVNSILKDGFDILVRDVSSLEFPAFSIAIPGMSELTFDPDATYFNVFVTMQNLLKNFNNITQNNIKEVVRKMETIVNTIGYEKMALLISLKDRSILPCEDIGAGGKYFLAICYIMDSQYHKAAKLLEDLSFLMENIVENPVEKIMVKAVYYYASAMDKLKDHEKAMYYIRLLFDAEVAEGIDHSFRNKDKTFVNHYEITEEDYVDNDDSFYLPFMKKLREAQRDNPIDQMRNKEIFE